MRRANEQTKSRETSGLDRRGHAPRYRVDNRGQYIVVIVGYVLLGLGLITAFGNLTGGGLNYRESANSRLIFALVIAALGAWLAFGR